MENNICQVSLEASHLESFTQVRSLRKDVNGVDLRIPGMITQDAWILENINNIYNKAQ